MTKVSASSQSAERATTRENRTSVPPTLTAEEFDAYHDAGNVDLEPYKDYARARRPGRKIQRVNVDFPIELLNAIDREAIRIGVTRQAFIKLRLADSIDHRFATDAEVRASSKRVRAKHARSLKRLAKR